MSSVFENPCLNYWSMRNTMANLFWPTVLILCLTPSPPPCQWPPHANGPSTRNEESCPPLSMAPLLGTKNLGPKGFLLENPTSTILHIACCPCKSCLGLSQTLET